MNRKFGRKKSPRELMLRNLCTSLILHEKIKTTTAKAKEVKQLAERMISRAKKADLSARRACLAFFLDKNATKKIFELLLPRFAKIKSGYIRSYHLAPRLGDGSKMMLLNLVQGEKIIQKVEAPKETIKKKQSIAKKVKTDK